MYLCSTWWVGSVADDASGECIQGLTLDVPLEKYDVPVIQPRVSRSGAGHNGRCRCTGHVPEVVIPDEYFNVFVGFMAMESEDEVLHE